MSNIEKKMYEKMTKFNEFGKSKEKLRKNIDIYHWENRSSFGIWELRYNSGYVLNSVLQMRLNKFQPLYSNVLFTGLPTQDETSETTVQNLYCLFLYTHDTLQL